MLTLLNVVLPLKRNFRSSLRAIYGIGLHRADKIASLLGLHSSTRIEYLSELNRSVIADMIQKGFCVDFELRRNVLVNINFLINVKCFRGYRHSLGLPTRGQRTHTNASTARKLLKAVVVERNREKNRGPKRNKPHIKKQKTKK